MPVLKPNRPVTQTSPQLLIENDLPVGRYRFELVVIDDAGQESPPDLVTVTVISNSDGPVFDPIPIPRPRPIPIPVPFPIRR